MTVDEVSHLNKKRKLFFNSTARWVEGWTYRRRATCTVVSLPLY